MRLTAKKIESILVDIVGEQGLPLIHELLGKDNISEFDLATKLKIDIKIIRKLLYILYNHNLVSFTRKKDKQKGWYIYYWTLIPENVRFNYIKRNKNLLERLKNQVEIEKKELVEGDKNEIVSLVMLATEKLLGAKNDKNFDEKVLQELKDL